MSGTKQQHPVASAPRKAARGARNGTLAAEDEYIISMLSDLLVPLGQALPLTSEVVLHDLARLPDSIVAVHGNVTGRRVGDPATDLLLERAASGNLEHMVNYRTRLPDGRPMRSTTMIVRNRRGRPVAALCVNSDLSTWQSLEKIAASMTGAGAPARAEAPRALLDGGAQSRDEDSNESVEVFARDVDELAAHLIHQAIVQQGVPVDLMRKEHKLAVVRSLQARGMFLLRDAVEMIATSLQVTRFTIYNYLNEIADEKAALPAPTTQTRLTKRKSPKT